VEIHLYVRNAGNESSAIQLYTKTKLKVQVTKYLLDFVIFFAAKRKPLRKTIQFCRNNEDVDNQMESLSLPLFFTLTICNQLFDRTLRQLICNKRFGHNANPLVCEL